MNPQAASTTGLAAPAAPSGAAPVSPNGAPGLPALPQGTTAPTLGQTAPTQFNTAGSLSAIAKYFQIPKNTAIAQAGVEGNKFNATTAYEGQLQATSEFAKERLDASKYKILQTKDGIQILDPVSGQPVDTATYVNRTGSDGFSNMMSALKQSSNPRDQQFLSDYNNFQTYMNALINSKNDIEAKQIVNSYQSKNPQLANLTPQQAASLFNSEYGDYLGVSQSAQRPAQPMYTPQLSSQDINYLLSRYIYSGNQGQVNVPGLDTSFGLASGGGGSAPGVAANPFANLKNR